MGIIFKMTYLKKIYQRYHKSSKEEKTKILDEFTEVCNYNRKYAIRLLSDLPPEDRHKHQRKRIFLYSNQTISILEAIWESTGYLCSIRLKTALPLWIPWAHQHFRITPEIEKQLLSISPAQIDRRLKNKKYCIKKRIYSQTKPGTLLKHHIPIKTDCWDVNKPGFLEVDLVPHCGASAAGDYIFTLDCVDIHTGWCERRAVFGRGQTATLEAFAEIKQELPFPLLGIDSDNDQAFINWHLEAFCKKNKIQFTRGRPYKKDDNAHIEQKNWTHVRKIFGYVRYDSEEARQLMNQLYRNELCLLQNLFQPSQKLLKKIRIGSKLKRIYGPPKTPFQRLLECKQKHVYSDKIEKLKAMFESADPFELDKIIQRKINIIYKLHTRKLELHKSFEERMNAEILKDLSKHTFDYLFT